MSKETNRLLGHEDEADGIEEYDNPLPDWWVGLLWLTVIWAVGYAAWYHFIADKSQEGFLAAEMQAAEFHWPEQAATDVEFTITPEAVAAGEAIYTQNCLMCHGAEDVIRIITEGVPEKGMLTWGPILGPEKVNQVAAYVLEKNAELTGN